MSDCQRKHVKRYALAFHSVECGFVHAWDKRRKTTNNNTDSD